MNRRDREKKGQAGEEGGGSPPRDTPELGGDPGLEALHDELSEIRIRERPSFGPELEGELERRWKNRRRAPRRPAGRMLAMAAGVVLLFTGLSVPPARAALVRLIQAVDLAPDPEPAPPPAAEDVDDGLLPREAANPAVERALEDEGAPLPGETTSPGVQSDLPREEVTVYPARNVPPEIWDRSAAREVISRFYPTDLSDEEIGGVVGLLIYVDREGKPSQFRVGRSSGIPELDRAALVAAPRLRFLPARRNGEQVGTWVAFDVRFDPNEVRPEVSGILAVGPGEEIAPMALTAAMPLPAELPAPPDAGTVGILVKLDGLPQTGEAAEIRVALEAREGRVRERRSVPFRPQGSEGFRRSWERTMASIPDGVLYLVVDLEGLEPGSYDAWVQVDVPTRGEVMEASAPVTVR